MGAQPGDGVMDVIDGEHDTMQAQRAGRRVLRPGAGRRGGVVPGQLQLAVAVRGPHHRDLAPDAVESGGAVRPEPFDLPPCLPVPCRARYEAAAQAQEQIDVTYAALAQLVGGRSDEVALFDNSTHAWNAAFYSIPLGPGDRILTGRDEYGSNVLAYLQVAQRSGAEIVVVPDDGDGQIDLGALARLVDERTKLIGLTWVPTSGGLVNPAAAVGRIARARAPCTSWTPPRPSASSPSMSTTWAAIC